MIRGGLAETVGGLIAYLASLGATGAVLGRFMVDWLARGRRDPAYVRSLTPHGRQLADDDRNWSLWTGMVIGALLAVGLGAGALCVDLVQR
jgi:hypothetical protein